MTQHRHSFTTIAIAISILMSACGQKNPDTATPSSPPPTTASPPNANSVPLVTGLPDFTQLVNKISPAVVNVRTSERVASRNELSSDPMCQVFPDFPACAQSPKRNSPNDSETEHVKGEGSGFLYTADGYILTNHHVIDGASSIVVTMADKKEFKAKLIGSDEKTDVAVLKIEGQAFPYLAAANSDQLKVGQWVIAAGSPFGLQNSITAGIISAINRDTGEYQSFIQTDTAVNRGNSGGPLINVYGDVVGINSQILSSSGSFAGIALAIPINDAIKVAEQIRQTGHVNRGRLGVSIQNLSPDVIKALNLESDKGALIAEVQADSAAQKGGIRAGDIVTQVNGKAIQNSKDLAHAIGNTKPGDKLSLLVLRQGKTQTFELTAGQ